jgi:hypothetical protein
MKAKYALEAFGAQLNDMDPHLPKSRGRCFDIGTWGGCGVFCPAFVEGECGEPQEIPAQEIVDAHGQSDAEEIMAQYPCFANSPICVNSQPKQTKGGGK